MSASPGHRKWPDHKVEETQLNQHLEVYFGDKKIAETDDAILLKEDDYPDRYYIRREDVNMEALERTSETSECPFKGKASYFSLKTDEGEAKNAVWTYEDPYDEHRDIKDRLAFYTDKFDEIKIEVYADSDMSMTS